MVLLMLASYNIINTIEALFNCVIVVIMIYKNGCCYFLMFLR